MAAKGNRVLIYLSCTKCKAKNYVTTKNRVKTPQKLKLKKFCKYCKAHVEHVEVK
ncbi:MAG: 50S ribosomal protein L33 [Candidatus Calescibacterium sp.]|nr:50S ribosomal protein L33 [Candidatus Calescibacterium sp.]MCX7971967.1 50S ribosomal protein L33 [bacterium]MDW8195447.1 50S ribosomal protein L33 [Candidatus Calescibacterium sp.]